MAVTRNFTSLPEAELFQRYRETESVQLRDQLIHQYDYIPEILARRFAGKGIEYDDLYQCARIGLMNAIERYDPSQGNKFTTFATPTIVGEIKRLFRDKGNVIRVPRRVYEIFTKASKIRNAHLAESGENMTTGELASALGVPVAQLENALEWGDNHFVRSLEQFVYNDGEDQVFSNLVGMEDNHFLMIEDRDLIDSFLESLSETEKKFVKYRYYDEMTQAKIARLLHVSQMNVSRMERKILSGLKKLYFESVND